MSTANGKPDRTLIIILSVIAVLVVVALVAVFTRGEPQALDPGTPEGVVQGYATAVIDGDEQAAGEFLTEDAFSGCEKFDRSPTGDLRVTLVSTTERAESADVKVSIVTSSGNGPFGADEYETEGVFDLVKVNGDWLIDDTPYELMICPNPKAAS
ncbi:hypothetical protein E3T26_08545 [Cryobacterium sp. TMT1-21]|uniref:Lipoprotein LpqB N-terminal domain-containing protein n=1 Tax=Cryobacterium shii TaxID=1259235 RepID=A0AAQ2HG60_9MICO|nr:MULTISPECIES: hypothetical protein [Cryobacterium]TFC49800.1 hypothetical protein E3O49_05880 [Cryobacterium shii]TFC84029.1 hypothetical protein E3T24_11010 [Cryobacterium sp. TmT2-59]TFD14163.1 hypothetical protein E3T26_08545 [Cryobacterium sp. TMT1-21]TFD16131.1 hypothetical protein E3T42_09740 [Cryobacterium sp. TMT4-10]TFD18452.1 hypothetical protein E3T32_12165 [Cryobacterium sp. TMT2-23]